MNITKRPIDKIFIHCSATPPKMDIGVEEIRRWHTQKGWRDIGYHLVGTRNDGVQIGRDIDIVGAHVRGYNNGSIGYCMVGGVDEYNEPSDNFTDSQWRDVCNTLRILRAQYPKATIHGHNEFAAKACPSFDVQHELVHGRLRGIL